MTSQKKAYLYAILATIIWSTVASVFKISLRHLDFLQLLCYSSLVAVITLFLILVFQGKLNLIFKSSSKEIMFSALGGFLNPFLYYALLFKAYTLIPAQEAQPLNYTWPIMLTLLSIPLLKQKIKIRAIFAIIASFIGVVIISTQGNISEFKFHNPIGAILALSTAMIWSLFWIINIKDKRDEVVKLFLNFCFGFLFTLILTLIYSEISIPDISGFIGLIYIGLFEMGVTFLIWLTALKLSKTTAKVSNIIYLVPFLSLIIIHFAVGEKILYSTIIGLVFIVLGIVIQQYSPKNGSI